MERNPPAPMHVAARPNPLIMVPVGIVFKSAIFYGGKLRASVIETEMMIAEITDRWIVLDDGTIVAWANIASISPLVESD